MQSGHNNIDMAGSVFLVLNSKRFLCIQKNDYPTDMKTSLEKYISEF